MSACSTMEAQIGTHFMQHVSHTWNNNHLELALHLTNHKLFVKSICPCENEKSSGACCEELAGEAIEPTCVAMDMKYAFKRMELIGGLDQ